MLDMSLTSFLFFSLFVISLIVYYLIPGKDQWLALLVFSVAFFCLSSTPYTGLYLIASIVATTLCARQMVKRFAIEDQSGAKKALVIGIVINVGILAILKYSNFFIGNLNAGLRILRVSMKIPDVEWLAPMGISFYTLSLVSYLLDVYWQTVDAQPSMLKTALFAGYFPLLTSGPIVRYHEVKDSLYAEHEFNSHNIIFGMERMLWGVFKKIVISSRLGIIVDVIYGNTSVYQGFYIWIAAAFFMLQLYTDFSGCMDIILGVSECYGIILPENFRTPFFSRSVQEFWQRWHITLGGWLRDYILYPILRTNAWRRLTKWVKTKWGKKASKQIPVYLAMLCSWLLMGLWHGGQWKYVLGQGIWFWLCIVLSQALEPIFKKWIDRLHINTECFSWHLFQSIRVFILVCFGNMFFRLDSLKITLKTIMIGFSCWNPEIFFDDSLLNLGLDYKNFGIMIIGLLILLVISVLQEKGSVRELLSRQNIAFQWIIILALVFSILIFGMYGTGYDATSFIYEAF